MPRPTCDTLARDGKCRSPSKCTTTQMPTASCSEKLFDEQYEHFFGRVIEGLDVEIVSWSLRATSKVSPTDRIGKTEKADEAKVRGSREIFDVQEGSFQTASIVARADMKPGDFVAGPAVITERETSTIITASREVIMQGRWLPAHTRQAETLERRI